MANVRQTLSITFKAEDIKAAIIETARRLIAVEVGDLGFEIADTDFTVQFRNDPKTGKFDLAQVTVYYDRQKKPHV